MHSLDMFPRSGKVSYPMLDAKKSPTTMISTLNPEKLMVGFHGIFYDMIMTAQIVNAKCKMYGVWKRECTHDD